MSKYINQYNNYAAYSGDSSNFQYPHAAYLNEEKVGVYDRDMGSVLMRFNDIVGTVTDGTTGLTVEINGLTWSPTIRNGYFYHDYNWNGYAIKRVSFNGIGRIKTVEQLGKKPWSAGETYAFQAMFKNCSNVESINMENVRSGIANSTSEMFNGCSKLTEIKGLDKLETSGITNMNSMFLSCSGLTSLDVSGFNTSACTNMGSMFNGCNGLTSLDLSNFDTSNVTDMSGMFRDCEKLTSLDVSGFNTSACTNMANMFLGCSGLTSLDLSNFNTSNVTTINQLFCECSSLTSLDLSNFNTSACTNIEKLFYNCRGLHTLNLSNWDLSNVTKRSNVIYYCFGLTSITANNTNQTTFDIIKSWKPKSTNDPTFTIHRDGYAWTYVNKQWVSTPE